MDRNGAIELLTNGDEGIALFNQRRGTGPCPNLSEAHLFGANLEGANLEGANLEGANLEGANLEGANLGNSRLSRAILRTAKLSKANLSGADLNRANLSGADLTEAHLFGADLGEASLREADLSEADLSKAHLFAAKLERAVLRGADLFGANLGDSRLSTTNLQEASLRAANLFKADLSGASLRGASLSDTDLGEADLSRADLFGADLSRADLSSTNLSRSNTQSANFTEAIFANTIIADISLRDIEGLHTSHHEGPSTIGIDTIVQSEGQIPEVFLRGCGVPESFITYQKSLAASPIEFYSAFISYSHKDKSFAQRLHDQLQARGIRCWLDQHALEPGDNIPKEIDRGIRLWDKVLLCASAASLSSWWVEREVEHALKKEETLYKERGKEVLAIIPLNLDGTLFHWEHEHAHNLQKRLASDFTGWESDNAKFEAEFERIVKALQLNSKPDPPKSKL